MVVKIPKAKKTELHGLNTRAQKWWSQDLLITIIMFINYSSNSSIPVQIILLLCYIIHVAIRNAGIHTINDKL